MNREVHVDCFFFNAVVPMVKARCDQKFFDPGEAPAEIGVDKCRVHVDHKDVGVHRIVGEAKDKHRDNRRSAEENDFQEVHPGARHPIHALGGVVDGVEAPEAREAVEGAMDPVLDEVRKEHDRDKLNEKRQAADPGADLAELANSENRFSGKECQERQDLDHHAADEEIEKVFPPFLAEDELLFALREKAFDRNEKQPRKDDTEDKPIEPEKQRSGIGHNRGGSGPAEQRSEQRDCNADAAQHLFAAENEAQCGKGKGENEERVKAEAKPGIRREPAQFWCGERAGGAHGKNEEESADAEYQSECSADPPAAEFAKSGRRFQFAPQFQAGVLKVRHDANVEN